MTATIPRHETPRMVVVTMTDTRTAIAEAVRNGAPIIVRPRHGAPYVIPTTAETEPAGSVIPDTARRESDEASATRGR